MQRTIKASLVPLVILIPFFCLVARMAGAKMISCKYQNPATIDSVVLPVRIPEITLLYSPGDFAVQDAMVASMQEGLTGDITVVNTSRKTIRWYLIVAQMQLGNDSGNAVSIAIFNVGYTGKSALDFPYMSWVYGGHGRPWTTHCCPESNVV